MTTIPMALRLLAIAALIVSAAPTPAATLGDFDCRKKVVVLYQPGPNWSGFRERLAEHRDFIKAKMELKLLAYGAPMTDASGKPVGGLFIYNEPDLDIVARLVDEDTFVKDGVVVYTVARWGMCQGKTVTN